MYITSTTVHKNNHFIRLRYTPGIYRDMIQTRRHLLARKFYHCWWSWTLSKVQRGALSFVVTRVHSSFIGSAVWGGKTPRWLGETTFRREGQTLSSCDNRYYLVPPDTRYQVPPGTIIDHQSSNPVSCCVKILQNVLVWCGTMRLLVNQIEWQQSPVLIDIETIDKYSLWCIIPSEDSSKHFHKQSFGATLLTFVHL